MASSTLVSMLSRISGVTRRAAGAASAFAMTAAPTRATITTASPARARNSPRWAPQAAVAIRTAAAIMSIIQVLSCLPTFLLVNVL